MGGRKNAAGQVVLFFEIAKVSGHCHNYVRARARSKRARRSTAPISERRN